MTPSNAMNSAQDHLTTGAEPPAEPTSPPAASAQPETNDKKRSHDDQESDNEESSTAAPSLKQPRIDESEPPQETKQDEDATSEDDDESPPSPSFQLPSTKMSEDDAAKFREADERRVNDETAVRAAHGKLLKARNDLTKAQAKYEEW